MKAWIVLLAFIVMCSNSFAAKECKTSRGKKIAETLANFELSGSITLLEQELFPDGSLVSGYDYEVTPAYINGLYQRRDFWEINTQARPGDNEAFSERLKLSWSGGPRYSTELTFYRFFKDACQAELSAPYTPKRMPLRVNEILEDRFKIGDYFVYKATFGVVLSSELLGLLSSPTWGIDAGASYLIEGQYKIHVVRIDENHVRLKIVARRLKSGSLSFAIGLQKKFEVFKVSKLNKQLERFVDPAPVKITANKSDSEVVLVDYVLDITDSTVQPVYENLLKQVKKFKSIGMANPFRGINELEGNLILDVGPLEDMFREDVLNHNVSRVKRNIHTSAEQEAKSLRLSLGNKIFGFNLSGSNSQSFINLKQTDETYDHYMLSSWKSNWDRRAFYSWSRAANENSLSAVFSSTVDFKNIRPINLILYDQQKKNRINLESFDRYKKFLKKALPKDIYEEVPFYEWGQIDGDTYNNFGSRFELIVAPEVILEAPQLTSKEIYRMFNDHVLSKGLKPSDYFTRNRSSERNGGLTLEERYEISLKKLSKHLQDALDKKLPPVVRLNAITKLRKNTLFKASGFGFLMALRPDMMKHWFHLDLDITSNEKSLNYRFGEQQVSSLYKKLIAVKSALDDEGLDILREAESLAQ